MTRLCIVLQLKCCILEALRGLLEWQELFVEYYLICCELTRLSLYCSASGKDSSENQPWQMDAYSDEYLGREDFYWLAPEHSSTKRKNGWYIIFLLAVVLRGAFSQNILYLV